MERTKHRFFYGTCVVKGRRNVTLGTESKAGPKLSPQAPLRCANKGASGAEIECGAREGVCAPPHLRFSPVDEGKGRWVFSSASY